tara:strand:+ start:100 stop:753 length:654 start_codon:yes stop_codon:yes gene_type:complete
MVQKSKGGKKCRSSISGKRKRSQMKHNRKDNYKKKKQETLECCVCMEEIDDVRDNVITCGKVNHPLCRECKVKCKECPMCRSHSIKPPVSQEVEMNIHSSSSKHPNQYPKKKISVEIISYNNSSPPTQFLSGVYHEIRKDERNYPIYKMLNQDKYIVHEKKDWKKDNSCRWAFKGSADSGYEWGWFMKFGKLFGTQIWNKYDYISHNDTIKINIQRI